MTPGTGSCAPISATPVRAEVRAAVGQRRGIPRRRLHPVRSPGTGLAAPRRTPATDARGGVAVPEPLLKPSTVRVPISLSRPSGRTSPWRAQVSADQSGYGLRSFEADGPTETAARQALTSEVVAALDRYRHPPI